MYRDEFTYIKISKKFREQIRDLSYQYDMSESDRFELEHSVIDEVRKFLPKRRKR